MQKRLIATLIALSAASAGVAQVPPPPTAPVPVAAPVQPSKLVRVVLTTAAGPIVLDLDAGRAPVTTANFLRYVDQKRLDGTAFYRAVKVTPDYGVIQAGVRGDPKRLLPPIAHEPTTKTGLSHKNGTISMARFKPGSATGDFFIVIGDTPSFDANPQQSGDNLGYAAFGKVVEGQDAVRKIFAAPTPPELGVKDGMKGQIIAAPIRIISARRAPMVKPPAPVPPVVPVPVPTPPKP